MATTSGPALELRNTSLNLPVGCILKETTGGEFRVYRASIRLL